MFKKVSELAEKTATNVSRRQFLGRVGRGAAATAAALGGLLALPAVVQAGKRVRTCSENSDFSCFLFPVGSKCGRKGTCRPVDPSDKSPVVDCTCREKGGGPKRKR